ncbi:dienelactone hydrolase family protein [Parvularcula sp. ZS-1/3]|uniref:Dienelactone hydrolase family protein n=1 Tax=Parvularcula mediterranea TaxID=2732508 RepID=A0A7Y3W4R6_9PROT|nr:dienelactone hydrolase family protein [Parvularcula mediterranea]NNU15819.1 dienelactone hydrolase family protein [Parvularcula mediterranea]
MTQATPPQGAYDLYDRYCHGQIDRRAFFDGLGRYAVGGLTVAGMAASLMPNYAKAQQVDPGDPSIATERYSFEAGGKTIEGLMAHPKRGDRFPAVLVVHENRGLNPYIEDVARRLAKSGYLALAPDALSPLGGYPGNDDDGRAMQRQRDRGEMLDEFATAARLLATHRKSTGKVGAVGFCFGGAVCNRLAIEVEELAASVPYYGGWPAVEDAEKVGCPLMIHLGGLDERVNAGWPPYEAALLSAGKEYSVHVYDGVNHGFHNDSTSRYAEEEAELSWRRTLAFFGTYLA